jgi:two-component system chemotaxis response regulator CheY
MIIDDSSVIRKVAKHILSGSDMLVIEAETASQALAMCQEQMPDVILVDSMLTDMPAVDCIRSLLALSHGAKPHIVLCVCELDVGAIMRAKRAGAAGYVFKPFTRPQLLASLKELQLAA